MTSGLQSTSAGSALSGVGGGGWGAAGGGAWEVELVLSRAPAPLLQLSHKGEAALQFPCRWLF